MNKPEELVRIIKKHGPEADEAFQQLYEATSHTALAVIKRYCDIPGDYEDLLQETYIRVYKSIDTLKDDTKALAWIRRIAGNTAVRHNMKKWPKMFSELSDEEGELPDIEDESKAFDPAAIADRKAVSEAVAQVLDTLPYDQRTALWMVYGQQVTVREMAESLGISENTIKSRLHQGRNKLLSKKEEFRKLGVEITAIPVAVLISMAFDDTVYGAAAKGVGAAAGASVAGKGAGLAGTGTAEAGAGMSEAGAAGAGMSGAGAAGAASGAAAGTIAKGMAVLAGLSTGAKAGIMAGVILAAAGGGLAVKAASSPHAEPVSYTEEEESMESQEELRIAEETEKEQETKDPYDNEANSQALAAYCSALLYDSRLISLDVMEDTEFAVVDINGDNINEVYAFVPGTSNGDTSSYLLYYTDGRYALEPMLWREFGVIDRENKFICSRSHMGCNVEVYSFDGKAVELEEHFWYAYPDMEDSYYLEDQEKNDRLAAYHEELSSKAYHPETVPVNRENMYFFFGAAAGDVLDEYYGSLSGDEESNEEEFFMEPSEPEEEAFPQSLDFDLEEEIQLIRQLYAYINEHIGTYEQSPVNKNVNAGRIEQETTYYYNGEVQVKQVISAFNEGFRIEVYDKEPDLDNSALSTMDTLAYRMARFLFATDFAGNEYRIYMKDGFVIRYIGPDRNKKDYPEGRSLEDFLREDVGDLPEGDSVSDIVNIALPDWWIGEEH